MQHRLLRASAGTGKTYQLVEAYVAQVLKHGLSPSEIVVITFTRKAAMELKLRIRKKLREAGVSHNVLTDLARAPISNFHGLALQLLRTFAFAGGLTAGSRILGESGDDVLLFMEACEAAWFSGDPQCAAAIEQVATHLDVDQSLPEALWTAVGRAREDGCSIDAALWGTYDPATLQLTAHRELATLRETLLRDAAEITGKAREKIAAFAATPVPDASAPPDAWASGWENAFGLIDRRGNMRHVYSKEQQDAWQSALADVAAEHHCVALVPALTTLLSHAWERYEAAKASLRAVDFADIILRLVHLLERREDLHQMLRQRYRAVLVDEAQDTNRLQRRMVHLLAGITGPAAGSTPTASLFVVGDWKQSIYTFRGADPESFGLFAKDLRDRGGEETTLSISRRSAPALVHGINHLGTALFDTAYEPLEPLEDADAAPSPAMFWCTAQDEPAVPSAPVAPPVGKSVQQDLFAPRLAPPEPSRPVEVPDPQAAARIIRAHVDHGAAPGDFAVLLATMTQAPLFAKALADVGIPAILGGGGGLYEQVEIVDTVALLSWLTDRRDHLSAAIALRSPIVGLSDEGLLALRRTVSGEPDGLEALHRGMWPLPGRCFNTSDMAILAQLAARLPALVASAKQHSAAAFFLDVDAALDVRAIYLALPGGEQRHANLNHLLTQAERFDDGQRGSATRFVRQQQDRIRRGHGEPMTSVPAAARRAVTISSVHQSKGLQYPVVLLANLGRKGRQDSAPVRYGRAHGLVFRPRMGGEAHKSARWRQVHDADTAVQDGELRRLLYVAVTRAERAVVFVGPAPETLGLHGFGGLLGPWVPQAIRDGRVAVMPLPPAPASVGVNGAGARADAAEVEARLTATLSFTLPAGTHFDLSVTQLAAQAHAAEASPATGSFALTRDLRAGLTFDPDGERDPPLDPLSRGRLAHQILAAMPRRAGARSIEAFIDAELNMAGFAPDDERLVDVRADVAHFLASPLGERLLAMPADARRHELPFAMALDVQPYAATLHGQIDLLVWDHDGPLLVDYKHAHQTGDVGSYLLQLNAYAAAVAQLCRFDGPIRSYLVFLRDRGAPFAHTITPAMRTAVATQASSLVHRLATAARGLS